MPLRARTFEKCFKRTEKGTSKKENLKDDPFEVARTRNCAEYGSDEKMRWRALPPSIYIYSKYVYI